MLVTGVVSVAAVCTGPETSTTAEMPVAVQAGEMLTANVPVDVELMEPDQLPPVQEALADQSAVLKRLCATCTRRNRLAPRRCPQR